jgi:replicative DNA helicase
VVVTGDRRLVEQATIGGLMLDPPAIGQVGAWLRRSDFTDPWLGVVYRVLRERRAAGLACDPHAVGLALREQLPPYRAQLPRLLDVLHATPIHPQPVVYARVVLDGGLRREVDGLGVILKAGALATAGAVDPGPLRRTIARLHPLIDEVQRRWDTAHGRPPERNDPAPDRRSVEALQLGADRYLQARPAPTMQQTAEHERQLVGALIVRHAAIPMVAGVLHPQWFVDPRWAATYTALLELHTRGEPVDAVTVACRVQRLAHTFRATPGPGEVLAAAETGVVVDPRHAASLVSADLTVRTADTAARSLSLAASNDGLRVPDLVHTARLLLDATITATGGMALRSGTRSQPATAARTLTGAAGRAVG